MPNGKKAVSYDEKISRGKLAIKALGDYRKAKANGNNEAAKKFAKILKTNIPYFGYGYIKDKGELVPYIPVCFYAFRVMVGLGIYFVALFAIIIFVIYRKDISKMRWIHIIALCSLPLGYIVSESGWLVAEFGRQPWTIQDMLPTCAAVSDLHPGAVMTTFFIFLVLFSTLLTVEISIMCKAIKKGPEHSKVHITND